MLSRKFYATFIDLFLIAVISNILAFQFKTNINFFFQQIDSSFWPYFNLEFSKTYFAVRIFNIISYLTLSLYLTQGKTFGSCVMGIKLNDVRREKLFFFQCFNRAVLTYFSFITLGLFLLPTLLFKKKSFIEFLSRTEFSLIEEESKAEYFQYILLEDEYKKSA